MTSGQLIIPEGKYISPTKLKQFIVTAFSDNELRDLCFEVRVDYESLPPGGKADKARELVSYMERNQRLSILVVVVRQYRPQFDWVSLLTDQQEEISFPIVTPPASIPRMGHETQLISKGITTLVHLLRSPEMRTVLVAFQTDFQATSDQIKNVNIYKQLHDLMQQLENRYFLLYNDQRRLPDDDAAWDSILLNEPELRGKIDDLVLAAMQGELDATEMRWTSQLEEAKRELTTAIESFELENLKSATRLIYRVLNRQPSRINAQLVTTAGNLRLDGLVAALQTIKEKLANMEAALSAQELIEQNEKAIAALSRMDIQLKALIQEHNALQELDDELRRVEATLLQSVDELEDAWYDIQPMVKGLSDLSQESWVEGTQKAADELDAALSAGNVVVIRRTFRRFRSQVGRSFRLVDMQTLALCQELQEVGGSLDLLSLDLLWRGFQ
ncbi:MAG: hypothetical protein KC443_14105 [Anaerolineales bacterium]|nr:hypothetical protein [Anaerolineales bacterium]